MVYCGTSAIIKLNNHLEAPKRTAGGQCSCYYHYYYVIINIISISVIIINMIISIIMLILLLLFLLLLLIVCSIKHQSTPPRPFRLQEATISRADRKTARPAVHIYCVDVLAAPAAFVR